MTDSSSSEAAPARPPHAELLDRAARAARELCEPLWEALALELRSPREQRVRELSQRLADVSSTVALLLDAPAGAPTSGERRTPPEPIWSERPPRHEPPGPPPPAPTPHPAAQALRERELARMRLVDEHEDRAVAEAPGPDAPIAVRDVRPEQGPSAWVNTVGRLLRRHSLDGLPFAVLLVELVDISRIEHSEAPEEVVRLVSQVEAALAQAMRDQDELTRESLGRYWLVAPETNGTGARMLAERLARLVRGSATHRGVPLEVAIGIAVCPEDGCDAPELAARADLSVYSARATGQPVARTEPPA